MNIAAPILGLIVVVWNPCSLTWHTYNWIMVHSMMKITTKIGLMRSTLLTLGALQPWMRIVVRTMLMCLKVCPPGPWIKPLVCLHEPMAEIIGEHGESASIKLCDHATLFFQRVALNIWAIHLAWVNKSMHPRMVFHQMDDGFRNFVNWMKDWHEIMMEHLNIR